MSHPTRLVTVVVMVLFVAGCTSDRTADTVVPPTTESGSSAPATSATTMTTVPPTTTPATTLPTTTAPATTTTAAPATGGEDFDRVFREIRAFVDDLGRRPDPDRVAEVYHPDCPCYESLLAEIQLLADNGWRYAEGNDTEVRQVTVLDRPAPDEVALLVVLHFPADQVLDASGAVVRVEEALDAQVTYLLRQGADGRWRIADS